MKVRTKIITGALITVVALLSGGVAANWAPDKPLSALAARWAPPPSTFVPILGMDVHLRDEGPRDDPTPIVLIHGTSASLHTWEGWVAALKDDRRVITFDLPGFGLTGPSPDGDYTIAAYVRFVGALLDKVGVERCVLGGNSLGGNIALATAHAMPDRVDKLVLVDSAGVYGDPSKVTPALVDRYFDMTVRAGNRHALVQRFSQSDFGADATWIAELKVSTLIVWGSRDRLIPPDYAERFHRDIVGSRIVVFPDLGHVPHEEDPVRTVAAVIDFLRAK